MQTLFFDLLPFLMKIRKITINMKKTIHAVIRRYSVCHYSHYSAREEKKIVKRMTGKSDLHL